ncbi:MAG: GNAT family N-acetyltransferase [Candidatus Amulumruptor caecigallinarius]|nr:GNAT family N-acetyltransferase [Candidatus Amulumruptor caecigallinarius]MCM1397496.1 GNAT family N-acetyltransferase [Candidatus Amulumruptor caecigallinarius]MCM1454398.1 GNAT family N-acetyltransferase [bacterium]
MTILPVTSINRLMEWRVEVIRAVFGVEPSPRLIDANRDYYMRQVSCGDHFAVEARIGGEPAGCGAICFSRELPSPDNPDGLCAYLMNIYVRPARRSQGVATAIVSHLVQEARARGCDKIYLETTDAAHSLYCRLGFQDLPGMMKLPLSLTANRR